MTGVAKNIQAAVIVNVIQSGADLFFETEPGGSLNLGGLTFNANGFGSAAVGPNASSLIMGPTSTVFVDGYAGASVPAAFGSFTSRNFTSGTGDIFGWQGGSVVVPEDYAGELLSASNTLVGASIADLTPGTYVWSWANDSITLNVPQVPVPAAAWLFGSALGLLGWM